MGLDQYLYKTTKEDTERCIAFKKINDEFISRRGKLLNDKYDEIIKGFSQPDGIFDEDKLTEEQKKEFDAARTEFHRECKEIADEIGATLCDDGSNEIAYPEDLNWGYELGYWRNDWPLHRFIVDNFGNPDNDNLVEVYLNEEQIQKVIDWAKSDGNGEESYDNRNTIETFSIALSIVRDGGVVYYHPWY